MIGRGNFAQIAQGFLKPSGSRLACIDIEAAAAMGAHVQDRIGPQTMAPGRSIDHNRRVGVVIAGRNLGRIGADIAVQTHDRLGLARRSRRQQQLGNIAGQGHGRLGRGGEQVG